MTLPPLHSSGALKGIDLLPVLEAIEARLAGIELAIEANLEAIRRNRWRITQLEKRR